MAKKTKVIIRNNSQLKCTSEEYADFYVDTEDLYGNYDPFTFIDFSPGGAWTEALSRLNSENALGVVDSEYGMPMPVEQWKAMIEKARKLPAYKELVSSNDLNSEFDKYLKGYGVSQDSAHYELFRFRLLNFVAYLYADYIDQAELDIGGLLLTDEEREKLMSHARELRASLYKLELDNGDDKLELRRLLKRLGRLNNKQSKFRKPSIHKGEAGSSSDHALRQLALKLVIFFKTVNKKTHTNLVKQILKKAVPSVSKTPLDNAVKDAKQHIESNKAWATHFFTDEEISELKDSVNAPNTGQYRLIQEKYVGIRHDRIFKSDSK